MAAVWSFGIGSNMNVDLVETKKQVKVIESVGGRVPGWRMSFTSVGRRRCPTQRSGTVAVSLPRALAVPPAPLCTPHPRHLTTVLITHPRQMPIQDGLDYVDPRFGSCSLMTPEEEAAGVRAMHGVALCLSPEDMARMDKQEGYDPDSDRGYAKAEVQVEVGAHAHNPAPARGVPITDNAVGLPRTPPIPRCGALAHLPPGLRRSQTHSLGLHGKTPQGGATVLGPLSERAGVWRESSR